MKPFLQLSMSTLSSYSRVEVEIVNGTSCGEGTDRAVGKHTPCCPPGVVSLDKCRSSAVQFSSYGDDEPFQLAFLEPQEKVQLMFRIEQFLDNVKEPLFILDWTIH